VTGQRTAGGERWDAIVVGAGHNGLVAATLLARAGWRVLVLEATERLGGAAVSAAPFAGHEVNLSRYSYLVSLFPRALLAQLGIGLELRRRRVSSFTPHGDAGVLISDDRERTRASLDRTLGDDGELAALERLQAIPTRVAQRVFDSLCEPLRSRADFERVVDDAPAWRLLFEEPLALGLERGLGSDLVRGIVATDALIGTFASLSDSQLRQNRCFLYHVVGNGTGRWDVPVGGMGALSHALAQAAQRAGAQLRVAEPVTTIAGGERSLEVQTAAGPAYRARHVLAGVAPAVLDGLLEDGLADPLAEPGGSAGVGRRAPEGAQLKLNLLLARLPRLRDGAVSAAEAFGGTFHVNEGYAQLEEAYAQAAAGEIPALPPCEAYCHSLTDPSILGPQLRERGAHTLTVFGLHMPARLFRLAHEEAKAAAVSATLDSINSVLAEPIEDCLLTGADGAPCLEARTPVELEAELGMPGGHIFHRDLTWPFAEHADEVGRWGVETSRPNVWICGAGARRGGGVSGIPGHNAARAVLESEARRA
jgi:phytoene dehydrogenase-like protein